MPYLSIALPTYLSPLLPPSPHLYYAMSSLDFALIPCLPITLLPYLCISTTPSLQIPVLLLSLVLQFFLLVWCVVYLALCL
jgi:hypothetical protein